MVGVTIRENANGDFFYNHAIIEKSGAAANPEDTASKAGPGESRGTAYDQSIQETGDGLNMAVRSLGDGPRGRITFADGSTIIELFESRNLSTFIHETGHLWLEELRADNVPARIRSDQLAYGVSNNIVSSNRAPSTL